MVVEVTNGGSRDPWLAAPPWPGGGLNLNQKHSIVLYLWRGEAWLSSLRRPGKPKMSLSSGGIVRLARHLVPFDVNGKLRAARGSAGTRLIAPIINSQHKRLRRRGVIDVMK